MLTASASSSAGYPAGSAPNSGSQPSAPVSAFPVQLPWLPLLAPLAVLSIYVLATRPFLRDENLPR